MQRTGRAYVNVRGHCRPVESLCPAGAERFGRRAANKRRATCVVHGPPVGGASVTPIPGIPGNSRDRNSPAHSGRNCNKVRRVPDRKLHKTNGSIWSRLPGSKRRQNPDGQGAAVGNRASGKSAGIARLIFRPIPCSTCSPAGAPGAAKSGTRTPSARHRPANPRSRLPDATFSAAG